MFHAFNLNLSLMFIAPNSFIKYFITYGMATKLQSVPLHPVHTVDVLYTYCLDYPDIFYTFLKAEIIKPHLLQTYPYDLSELLKSLSLTT